MKLKIGVRKGGNTTQAECAIWPRSSHFNGTHIMNSSGPLRYGTERDVWNVRVLGWRREIGNCQKAKSTRIVRRSKSIDGGIVQGEARRTTSRSLAENERKRGESFGIIREMQTTNNFLVGPPSISVPELAFHRVSHESLSPSK